MQVLTYRMLKRNVKASSKNTLKIYAIRHITEEILKESRISSATTFQRNKIKKLILKEVEIKCPFWTNFHLNLDDKIFTCVLKDSFLIVINITIDINELQLKFIESFISHT